MVARDVSQIIRQLNVKLLLYEVPTINRFIMLSRRRCGKKKKEGDVTYSVRLGRASWRW